MRSSKWPGESYAMVAQGDLEGHIPSQGTAAISAGIRRLRVGRFYCRVQFNFALVRVSVAEIVQQLHESKQFIPTGIRDGAILQIARLPKDEVITISRQLAR